MTKPLWLLLGWTSIVLAILGAALPILPTVPFLLIAAFCFEKSSPRAHRWLLSHGVFGPPIRDWQQKKVIRPKAKLLAIIFIFLGFGYGIFFRNYPLWVNIILISIWVSVSTFILTRKSS